MSKKSRKRPKQKTSAVECAPSLDKTVEMPEISEVAVVEQIVSEQPQTQEFSVVAEIKEQPLYELVRTSSAGYAKMCKKLCWFGLHNSHLIIYTMFFLVLAVFALYYGFYNLDKTLCIFSALTAAFMLYVISFGPRLFAGGMEFDEKSEEGTVVCAFYADNMCITCGKDTYTVPYTSITKFRYKKHCVYFRLKNIKAFPNGVIMEKPASKEVAESILNLVKQRKNTLSPPVPSDDEE